MSMWKTRELASVCTVFGDGDWIESKDQSPEGVRLVQTGNVGEGEFKDRAEKARFISQDTFKRLRCTEIFAGDCLISRLPDPVGRACLIPETGERMITAVDCTIVRFDRSKLLPEFFVYYSQAGDYLAAVEREATGTTRKRISRARLGQIPVPLVPPAEQRRIVAILDEAFEGIATAKASAEKNLQNARELFRSHLGQVFMRHSESSSTQPLEALTESGSPITYGVVKPGDEGDVAFVRGGDIAQGRVLIEQLRTIDEAVSRQYRRTLLRGGELLISLVGQPGQVAVAPEELKGANIARQVGLIRLSEQVDAEYVRYFLQSPVGQAALGAKQSGSVQQVINLGELREVLVPIPALTVQREATSALGAFSASVEHLTELVQSKRVALDELKKSLLHQAFIGALTEKSADVQVAEVA